MTINNRKTEDKKKYFKIAINQIIVLLWTLRKSIHFFCILKKKEKEAKDYGN